VSTTISPQTTLDRPPIFVIGTPRSGTTLVARILGRHHAVLAPAPGETHFFQELWTRRGELGALQDEAELSKAVDRTLTLFGKWDNPEVQKKVDELVDREALLERTHTLGGGYGALYYAFTSLLAESEGKTIYCDDTPKHLFYLHTILDLFPTAKAIGCTRDPRDFLCSYKNYWRVAVDQQRIGALYHPVNTSLLWRSSSNLLLRHANDCCRGRVLMVNYENLVQHPEATVSGICAFLGIEYSDDLIEVDASNSSFESPAAGIFTTSIGRWHTCLSPEEAWCVQKLAKENMGALGYQPEPVKPNVIALLGTWLSAPLALAKAVRANATKTGPLTEYLSQRLAPLLRK
jgi:hypothetical protein